jgi:hypothetical protein
MDPFLWLVVAVVAYFILRPVLQGFKSGAAGMDGKMICPACGTCGVPKTVTRGSMGIEILLWLCFIVPGIIYSLWRLSTRGEACPACGHAGMIPANSPNGKRLAQQFETQ